MIAPALRQTHMRVHTLMHARTRARLAISVKIFIDDECGTYWDGEISDNDDGQDDNDDT